MRVTDMPLNLTRAPASLPWRTSLKVGLGHINIFYGHPITTRVILARQRLEKIKKITDVIIYFLSEIFKYFMTETL